MQVMPGLVLGFLEVTVLTSISVAISTRLPMLANLVVCILVFFLGHLSPVLVEVADAGQRQRTGGLHGPVVRLGAPLARVLQRRPVDLNRCGHSLGRLRIACIRLLRVVQWSSALVCVPLVRGSRPGLTDRAETPERSACEGSAPARQPKRYRGLSKSSWPLRGEVRHRQRHCASRARIDGQPGTNRLDPIAREFHACKPTRIVAHGSF